jgi:hypothetical protein
MTSREQPANPSTSPSVIVRRSFTGESGLSKPAFQAISSVKATASASCTNTGSSPAKSPAAAAWSTWAWVATIATGVLPAARSIACTASGSNPGSTTTASSLPSAESSQQFVP